MIDLNDPAIVEWDSALAALCAAHEGYRQSMNEPSGTQARATLAVARERYEAALEKLA